MATAHRYITKEYRALLRNAALVLSIVMFAVVGFDITLSIIAPNWPIRLFVSAGVCWLYGFFTLRLSTL